MMKKVYVLVMEKNDAFLGIYTTEQEALKAGKAFRVPTRVLPWNVIFPLDFSKYDEAVERSQYVCPP